MPNGLEAEQVGEVASDPPWLEGIEGEHVRALILSDAQVISVIAGPGSGKTTGIKRRVQRLVQRDGVDAGRIFVGTFTRAIAGELRAALGEEIRVSTLHSLARKLLHDNPAARGGRRLRFLLRFEEDCLLYDVARDLDEPHDQRYRRDLLNRTQSSRSERTALPDARFAGFVDRWLRDHGGMLIGDVVPLAVDGLEAGDIPRGSFDHVFIDEYQDLTAAEQAMVELVWSEQGSLVVLGDNDQSIYSFRFNHPGGITDFAARMEAAGYEVLVLSLPENRRCGTSIVDLANLMMAEAGSTKDPMVACREEIGTATPVYWETIEEEIEGLATYMRENDQTRFLVLVPRRFVGHRLAEQIGEDARTAFHQEVLEHPIVQERFALGLLIANPDDSVALRAWLGFRGDVPEPHTTRNAAAYASIRDANRTASELVAAVADGTLAPSGDGQGNVRRRIERLEEIRAEAPTTVAQAIDYIFDVACADQAEDEEKRRWIQQDAGALNLAAQAIVAEALEEVSLASVLDQLAYRIATRAPLEADADEPRVRIMTLHSAKGLEGDAIVLAGIADQMIPGSATGAVRDEQRRLLYVAVTRARQELVISWARSMRFADAMANGVRRDQVFTAGGERRVRLSKSQLLPAGLPAPSAGADWQAQGD
jgi:DNA helicase II / ATP-dependent DNA helicase PcrA